jgi:hypothetical protein
MPFRGFLRKRRVAQLNLDRLDHPHRVVSRVLLLKQRDYLPDPELAAVPGGERVTYRPVRDDRVELAELVTLA